MKLQHDLPDLGLGYLSEKIDGKQSYRQPERLERGLAKLLRARPSASEKAYPVPQARRFIVS